jgi:hypothetical protein
VHSNLAAAETQIVRLTITDDILRKTPLILWIISFVIAAVVFGDGARRVYSGIFFVLVGVVMIANAKLSTQDNDNSSSLHYEYQLGPIPWSEKHIVVNHMSRN